MNLSYDGVESPLRKPATSPEDIDSRIHAEVSAAITEADATIDGLDRQITELQRRRDRVAAHRAHLVTWIGQPFAQAARHIWGVEDSRTHAERYAHRAALVAEYGIDPSTVSTDAYTDEYFIVVSDTEPTPNASRVARHYPIASYDPRTLWRVYWRNTDRPRARAAIEADTLPTQNGEEN